MTFILKDADSRPFGANSLVMLLAPAEVGVIVLCAAQLFVKFCVTVVDDLVYRCTPVVTGSAGAQELHVVDVRAIGN